LCGGKLHWDTAANINWNAFVRIGSNHKKHLTQFQRVAIGNPERHVSEASHCGSKQQ